VIPLAPKRRITHRRVDKDGSQDFVFALEEGASLTKDRDIPPTLCIPL